MFWHFRCQKSLEIVWIVFCSVNTFTRRQKEIGTAPRLFSASLCFPRKNWSKSSKSLKSGIERIGWKVTSNQNCGKMTSNQNWKVAYCCIDTLHITHFFPPPIAGSAMICKYPLWGDFLPIIVWLDRCTRIPRARDTLDPFIKTKECNRWHSPQSLNSTACWFATNVACLPNTKNPFDLPCKTLKELKTVFYILLTYIITWSDLDQI